MDWIKQRTFQNWVIGILVALNLLALTTVWIQSNRTNPPPPKEARNGSDASVSLMQRELGLSADQAQKYEQLRTEQMGSMKEINDALDSLKLCLIDDIFDSHLNDKDVDAMAARIGVLESKLEVLRFKHFSALAQICNPEQKAKLHPILQEVIGKRGPDGKPAPGPDEQRALRPGEEVQRLQAGREERLRSGHEQERKDKPASAGDGKEGRRPPQREDGQAPPSLEEKLDRYVQRLALSSEQSKSVERILKATKVAEESFKSRVKPTEDEFESEKQKLLAQEDQRIMQVLNQKQKNEFEQLVKNRAPRVRN